jgi:hypothetical protein
MPSSFAARHIFLHFFSKKVGKIFGISAAFAVSL